MKTIENYFIFELNPVSLNSRYFNHVEIDEIDAMIMNHRKKIEQLSCYSTEGCGNHLWPIGVPAPFKPLSRFDVLRWEYFNETHIFFAAENQVATPMNSSFTFASMKIK